MADIEKIKEKSRELAGNYGINMIVLFGSRADGTARKKSDADIAYVRKEPLSFRDQLSLGAELAPLFGTEAVDVVHLNKTSPVFMYEIMKKAKVLFTDNVLTFPNFFSYSLKRLEENMFLYDLKFARLCKEYGV